MLKTGTYIGDGAATQAIIGVGFQPTFVAIWERDSINQGSPLFKSVADGLNCIVWTFGVAYDPLDDAIISLDAGGFTVGDGTSYINLANVALRNYTYVAMKP